MRARAVCVKIVKDFLLLLYLYVCDSFSAGNFRNEARDLIMAVNRVMEKNVNIIPQFQ